MSELLLDRHVAEGRGDRPAIRTTDGRVLSYGDLLGQTNRVGNALREAGVEPEQRVAIALHDGPEFVAAFLGAMKIGAVPVPLNTAAPPDDLRYFVEHSRSRVIVAEPEVVARLAAWLRTTDELSDVAVAFVAGAEVRVEGRIRGYKDALGAASSDLRSYPTRADEPSYWLFSSGTTGRPKAAVHTHGDMLACVSPYADEVIGISPDDITFSVARLFFSYGLVNSLYIPLLAAGSVLLSRERPDPAALLDIVARHRPTLLFSVPTAYARLCAALESAPARRSDLASVRLAISAGEALPAPLYRRWLSLTGIELLDGLGSTEVGYIYCSQRPGQVRPGSSGRPIGNHELKLVDETGATVLVPDVAGELWVRAASAASYYWNDVARTRHTFVGEWTRTGDRYRRDADGFYWNEGREDDVFKVSGQWVSPMDVESCLLEHPAVLECAVVGREDGAGLVKAVAFVVRKSGVAVTVAELQAHVRSRLLPHTYPRQIEFVDILPKTATGKIQRYRLRTGT